MPVKLTDVIKMSNELPELHRRLIKALESLPADTFLNNEELAERGGCTVSGGIRKFSSKSGREHQCLVKDGPVTVRFWGSKKSIQKLKALRQQAEEQAS